MVRCFIFCNIVNKKYDKKHECGQCSTKYSVNEVCYTQWIKEHEADTEDPPSKYLYIFYEFEMRQGDNYNNYPMISVHSPVLCVVQPASTDCLYNDDFSVLRPTCGIIELIFDRNPVNQLLVYLESFARRNQRRLSPISNFKRSKHNIAQDL